jgi:DNA-binding GntR family transcriptional regulator
MEVRKERKSLRQEVYSRIKQEIVTCQLSPGESISELQFVDRYQVSKTPIREALTVLHKDGLVHYTPNRGFTVAPVSIRDVQEIFEARVFFETNLFRLALVNITDENITLLDELAKVEDHLSAPSPIEVILKTNEDFHLEIARIAGNNRLLGYYRLLLNEAQRLIFMDLKTGNSPYIWHSSHHKIMEAIHSRDEEAGVNCIREVLLKAKRRVLGFEE